jgi:D-alanyl-D-alanine dipeptidase
MNRIGKIRYWLQIFVLISIMVFSANSYIFAQSNLFNKYGLLVIKDINIFQKEIVLDSNKKMVDLRKAIPGLVLDLKYATTDNFMHQILYPFGSTTFLRKPAADALKLVINDLKKLHLTIKIFDAYRPYSVTEKMWQKVPDDRYAADPAKGSGHNRGIAVDLTLIDLKTKKELPMGTGFDNFSDTAHPAFTNLPKEMLHNRNILKSAMEKYGFLVLSTEWWHFYLPDTSTFELLDLSFSDLKKLNRKKDK